MKTTQSYFQFGWKLLSKSGIRTNGCQMRQIFEESRSISGGPRIYKGLMNTAISSCGGQTLNNFTESHQTG